MFNKHGKIMLGTEGVSNVIILGFAEIADPDSIRQDLTDLRLSLVKDPYFTTTPSFDPGQRKTALGFHAKDDLPEVRRMVYELLRKHDVKVQVVIRRKSALLDDRPLFKAMGHKITSQRIYEEMITRLFKNSLHFSEVIHIMFSQRGTSDRNTAYQKALEQARKNFWLQTGIKGDSEIKIYSQASFSDPCLQVIDYLLWPVFRLYEKQEDRFFNYMAEKYSLIVDVDDRRRFKYGEYYAKRNRISLEKIQPIR